MVITTDPTDIEEIKEYYEQPNVHRFDNLDEMDQFLERHNFPKITQEETDNPMYMYVKHEDLCITSKAHQ